MRSVSSGGAMTSVATTVARCVLITPSARRKIRTYLRGASASGCGNAFGITSREIASPNMELMSIATAVGMSPSRRRDARSTAGGARSR